MNKHTYNSDDIINKDDMKESIEIKYFIVYNKKWRNSKMKNKVLIIMGLGIIICIVTVLIAFIKFNKQKENKQMTAISKTATSKIELNSIEYINQLENVKIAGTNDTFMITENVNFEGVSGNFAIDVPYTFIVNGIEYNGVYTMGSNKDKKKVNDKNPKYDIKITNIKNDYKTEIVITNK